MIDPRDFLQLGQQLHGHKCPAMPLGLRAGAAAMNALGVERARDGQLLAVVELGDAHCAHCFADGVQAITGCTFGKGSIRKEGWGKFGLTLIERATGRAVRVVPLGEAQLQMKQSTFFKEYRMKGVPASQVPDEIVEPLVQKVMSAPQEALLRVGEPFERPVEKRVEQFSSFLCEECGEMVIESYGREAGGRRLCIPCAARLEGAAAGA